MTTARLLGWSLLLLFAAAALAQGAGLAGVAVAALLGVGALLLAPPPP